MMSANFSPFTPFLDDDLLMQDNTDAQNAANNSSPLANIFAPPAHTASPTNSSILPTPTTLPMFSTTAPHSHPAGCAHSKVNSLLPIHPSESSNAFSHSGSNSANSDALLVSPNNLHHSTPAAGRGPRADSHATDAGVSGSANLYVASLPASFTDDELLSLFAPFGPIVSSKVMFSKASPSGRGVCKGYGFVLFKNESDAIRAQAQMIGHVVGGNKIQVRRAKSGSLGLQEGVKSGGGSGRNSGSHTTSGSHEVVAARGPGVRAAAAAAPLNPAALALPQVQQQPQPMLVAQQQGLPLFVGTTNIIPSPVSVASTPNAVNSSGYVMGQDGLLYVLVPASSVIQG